MSTPTDIAAAYDLIATLDRAAIFTLWSTESGHLRTQAEIALSILDGR